MSFQTMSQVPFVATRPTLVCSIGQESRHLRSGMATDTIVPFLRDLSEESITSKAELLTLAFLLGLKNPHQTVERLVGNNPKDIRQATWNFFVLWNDGDSSVNKLDKLKTAYILMNQEGLFQRVTGKHNLKTQTQSAQKQIELAEPDSNSSTIAGEISFWPDRTNTFLLEICKNITSIGDLQTVAISCGCYPDVEAATSNWPTDILQAVFDVILRWWSGSFEDEERKISRLEEGFNEMKKPVVFNNIVRKLRENRPIPQGEFRQNMQRDYGIQPRFPDGHGAHSAGNIGQRIGTGDQRTDAAALATADDMDTSEDITSNGATGFTQPSVSASVPVNRSGGSDLQNRNRQCNLLDCNTYPGIAAHSDLKTSPIQNASSGTWQQLTLYPHDKKVAMVLIVNNICGEFKQTENDGCSKHEMDTNQLRDDFVNIGCDVSYHKDLHGDEMRGLRDDIKRFSFNDYNMFISVIVCHCDEAGTLIDAKKDIGVPFNDLVKSAAENSTLRGKPKVFFKHACRGKEIDYGSVSLNPYNFGTRRIPEFADVAIAYPTSAGHQSMLNTKQEHLNPIQALYQSLRIDRIPRPRTLSKLFFNWKRILNETEYIAGNGHTVKQTPGVYDSLRDEVYY